MAYSTQQSIPIAGVKDGIVILKNGSYRMILEITAINFSLKSEQEQNSLVFQYQSFLNSLHFPIEVVIRSKRLDLNPYLSKIRAAGEKSINDLIKMQTDDYIDFVGKLISIANIMKKSFYVVIPYDPISVKKLNLFEGLFAKTQKFDHLKITDTDFQAATSQLTERGNVIASGLGSMGLHCFQLSTEEIIELFYQIYNPEEAGKERIADVDTLSSPVIVAKSEAQSVQTANNQQNNEAFQRSIDNASIVQEQQKEAAQQRRQEATKDGEKQMRVAQTPSPNPNSVIPNNETANNQNLPPQQPVAPQQAPMASDQQINSQTNG